MQLISPSAAAPTVLADTMCTAARAGRRAAPTASFRVGWATSAEEVREAQRLRFRIFATEMGARLNPTPGALAGHDTDPFDPFCEHLLVRAVGHERHGEVIATCRVLTPAAAQRAGSRYTDREFDLQPVCDLLPRALEMGRVCVEPAWRNGLVLMALWQELGGHMAHQGLDTLIGCASVSYADGGELACFLWHDLKQNHLVPLAQPVQPRTPFRLRAWDRAAHPPPVPALIRGYLRCGAKLLGPPAFDASFNTVDFPMLLRIGDLPHRYSKRIFGS